VDCFQGKAPRKGKEIDTTQWFKGNLHGLASSTPPVYQSFMEYAWTLVPGVHQDPPPLNTHLSLEAPYSTPLSVVAPNPQQVDVPSQVSDPMAFQSAYPQPFIPRGFHPLQIQGRRHMARAVVSRVPPTHEDWAIMTIDPLPNAEVLFGNVHEVMLEFLVRHKRVRV
jgi:hypothetical protein